MAVYVDSEPRIISGTGSLRLSEDEQKARVLILNAEIVRQPTQRYRNFNYTPPRERYGTLSLRRGGIVYETLTLEYPARSWFYYPDPGGQALIAIQCAYKGILTTFVNLGVALNLVPIIVQNDIADYTRIPVPWDEVVFTSYADTAVRLIVQSLAYDICGEDSGLPQPPPPPLVPPEEVPPGTPLEVSPPYDPNDPTEPFEPFPEDTLPSPPMQDPCVPSGATVNFTQVFPSGTRTPRETSFAGLSPIRVVVGLAPNNGGFTIAIETSQCVNGQVTGLYSVQGGVFGSSGGTAEDIVVTPSNVPVFINGVEQ